MPITMIDAENALALLTTALGLDPTSESGIADLLREEVSARGLCRRSTAIRRVIARVGPAASLSPERVGDVCDTLVREGDFILAPGGELAPTPLRAVESRTGEVRVVCSLPTSGLSGVLGRPIVRAGSRRSAAADNGLITAVLDLGGLMLTADQWSRVARTPHADDKFIAGLDHRLGFSAEMAGSLERDGALDWLGLVTPDPDANEMVWRRAPSRLWRARHPVRRFVSAWTAGESPATSPFVTLSADDAARARFAVARQLNHGPVVRVHREAAEVIIEVQFGLPLAEYRRLSLVGRPVGDVPRAGRWALPPADSDAVLQLLTERLGIRIAYPNDGG